MKICCLRQQLATSVRPSAYGVIGMGSTEHEPERLANKSINGVGDCTAPVRQSRLARPASGRSWRGAHTGAPLPYTTDCSEER